MVRALVGWLSRSGLLVSVLLLAPILTVSAAGGVGVSRGMAARHALRALGASQHSGAQIVFGLPVALPAGTVISVGGPEHPSADGHVTISAVAAVAVLRSRAWLFYQDLAPFQQYAHAGRVALVNASTGNVTVSRRLSWPPVVDGRLPVFLGSERAYTSPRYRVLYRPYVARAAKKGDALVAAVRAAQHDIAAALDPSLAGVVASLLAEQHACTVRFSDTVRGGYYALAHVAQSRAALDYRFAQLGRLAPEFRSWIYSPASGLSPTQFVSKLVAQRGCQDVLLYLAGAGYPSQPAVNIGMSVGTGVVLHQDVTLAQLHSLISAHPGASGASRF